MNPSQKSRASMVDYPVDMSWRFAIYEEPGDIVIRVDHIDDVSDPKWHNVVRLEQSGDSHRSFHIHLSADDRPVDIPDVYSIDEKITKGIQRLREMVEKGLVVCGGDVLEYSSRWEEIKVEMLNRAVDVGTTVNTRSISGKARIIQG